MHESIVVPTTAELWRREARGRELDAFVATFPWLVLVGEVALNAPRRPTRTLADPRQASLDTLPPPGPDGARPEIVVQPIRKHSGVFDDMITVGRTSNHDVVLRDVTVSKFHAWFKAEADGIFLTDVGSHNGSRVDDFPCAPRHAVRVRASARIRFGAVELTLVDAEGLWRWLRLRD
jgi:hypothetical protein